MPLSATDLDFLKRHFNRRLQNARWETFMRFVHLAMAIFCIGTGWAILSSAPQINNFIDDFNAASAKATTRIAASPSGTQPVTRSEFYESERMLETRIVFQAKSATVMAELEGSALAAITVGCCSIIWILARWNVYRRDRILITLLRDKFPELN